MKTLNLIKNSYKACYNPNSSVLTGLAVIFNTLLIPVALVAVLCGKKA